MSDFVWPPRWQPPGSHVPGILQARTLEWVAISFSNAWKWKVKAKPLSRVWLPATPWTAVYQAPPSMGFSRQEYWSGVPLPSPNNPNKLMSKFPPGTDQFLYPLSHLNPSKTLSSMQFLFLPSWFCLQLAPGGFLPYHSILNSLAILMKLSLNLHFTWPLCHLKNINHSSWSFLLILLPLTCFLILTFNYKHLLFCLKCWSPQSLIPRLLFSWILSFALLCPSHCSLPL